MARRKDRRPSSLQITARKVQFDLRAAMGHRRYWHGNDPVFSHLVNALQATFPEGERFFIDAARDSEKILAGRGTLHEGLSRDLRVFIQQEALHGQQHRQWTEALVNEGYTKMAEFDDQERRLRLWFDKHVPASVRLSITAAAEHYTASLAYLMAYVRPELITESDSPFRELLLYHAMEEVEHKSVCYDLYQRLSGSYILRMFGLVFATFDLAIHIALRQRYLMKADGLWDRAHRRRAHKLLWGRNGLLRGLWPRIRSYVHPSFHPWQTDEREKMEKVFGRLRAEAGIPPFRGP